MKNYKEFINENVIPNYESNMETIREIAKKKGIDINGDYISLYHGTSLPNFKKILKSGMLKSGTWLASDFDISKRYANMSTNGKPVVDLCTVYIGALYYNGYFTTLCDLHFANGRYTPKEMLYK